MAEQLRSNVASPDYRASYFSGVRKQYELLIDILMQLERQQPNQNFAAKALLASVAIRRNMHTRSGKNFPATHVPTLSACACSVKTPNGRFCAQRFEAAATSGLSPRADSGGRKQRKISGTRSA